MGYNTTVVVMNDALHMIANDPEFGKNLASAISHLSVSNGEPVDVPAYSYRDGEKSGGVHCNAATAIETHHADGTIVVAVGGNMGEALHKNWLYPYGEGDRKERILRELADELGFTIRRKPSKK